ncbi:M20/M25/M40 family metallo-hydrolase [Subsaxibacter sp. CAU 1640]|uniref:M20/M25/M40 family metallo-hydrolase n=1 Tax=Subsaxibacter sp. CAU 1640 TaxID=2933271 RepID=UPI002004F51F|nr:M20/M25/M40 family metallo-hydrolase [Subsaxibacter sp. CAU 1640]MCK7591552.1 M20/M25/M40 family metallo-hydrolase [Subsaxibacter sp. CAU 1640]
MKYLLIASFFITLQLSAQSSDADVIKSIYSKALTDGKSYSWLDHLSNQIGSRLSGSLGAEQAVEYTKAEMEKLGFDKVWLQPVMVPKWVRGAPEFAYIETSPGKTTTVNICALGGSIATPNAGVKANIIEVKSLKELETLGRDKIEGKIVFFNRPMQADAIRTFDAYSGAVDQRGSGAKEAAKFGAVGVIVRSMNLRLDDFPHTGGMGYGDLPASQYIPAAAISTNDAELLSGMLSLNKDIKFFFRQNCQQLKDVQSYNVIGEIKGSEFPNEYIVVGGHLDSWDLGDGSHDDGAGCVQSMDALRILKKLGYKPKRTIRVVLFMNEENGLRGGTEYAKVAKSKGEKHIFALESDSGGFTPRGFSFDTEGEFISKAQQWASLFEPYLIHQFVKGYGGADIGPLKDGNVVLAGFVPDSQRYFDYHHAKNDTFDAINKRELELGTATMASMIYLVDKYGVN